MAYIQLNRLSHDMRLDCWDSRSRRCMGGQNVEADAPLLRSVIVLKRRHLLSWKPSIKPEKLEESLTCPRVAHKRTNGGSRLLR
jgi:hypothetical protein